MKVVFVLFCLFVFDSFAQTNKLFTKSFEESRKSLINSDYFEIKYKLKYSRTLTTDEIQILENKFLDKKGVYDFQYIAADNSIEVHYLSYIDDAIIEYLVESISVKYTPPTTETVKVLLRK